MVKNLLLIFLGIIGGLWISWPGIIKSDSWACAIKVINQSKQQSVSLKALLAISPKYFLNRRSYKGNIGKTRVVGDACFR